MRGNQREERWAAIEKGSIPARAGEPPRARLGCVHNGVYPRACGGTHPIPGPSLSRPGLSPRVRGNRGTSGLAAATLGSIPARAGEPTAPRHCRSRRGVYPRACGGTALGLFLQVFGDGLSPRVRGNLASSYLYQDGERSIPARAGEPRGANGDGHVATVYPRACGGTSSSGSVPSAITGLSPRVRGNPEGALAVKVQVRSIPARAGEPSASDLNLRPHSVYPRACGGTRCCSVTSNPPSGLSPRVRGNHAG